MANELMMALDLLEKEKKINKEDLLATLRTALASAYRKYYNAGENVEVDIDEDGGLLVLFADGSTQTVTSGEVSVRGMYGYL